MFSDFIEENNMCYYKVMINLFWKIEKQIYT